MNLHQAVKSSNVDPLFRSADKRKAERADNWFEAQLAAGRREPFGIVGDLTPELAEKLLASNPNNRKLSRTTVDKMKRDIEAGNWELNGETIIVSEDGSLNDGQHRCTSVVETGRVIKTAFWFGATRASRMTVDTGAVRTVGNFLEMRGVQNSKTVAACCNWLIQLERTGSISPAPDRTPTKQEQLEWWQSNRNIEDSVSFVANGSDKVGGRSLLAVAHFTFQQIDPVAADYFIQRLIKGDGLMANDPIWKLREQLISKYVQMRDGKRGGRLTPAEKFSAIVQAWNAKRTGRRTVRITFKGDIPKIR